MSDPSAFVFLFVLLLLVVAFLVVMRVPALRRRLPFARAGADINEVLSEKFRRRFFSALSEVVFADDLRKSISSISLGIMQAFEGDTFIFKRDGESASLVGYAAKNVGRITNSLAKAGIRIDVSNIPLTRERAALFEQAYGELEDPFQLISDLATSAVSRKIQNELRFILISFTSITTGDDGGDYLILVLLREKIPDIKRALDEFGLLLKSAIYLSDLKKRLDELENRFDEQFIRAKNEVREKEGIHLSLFDEMPIPAAVLDERGVITEANEALKLLFEDDINAVGQSLSSIMGEEQRRDFIETLMSLGSRGIAEINLQISNPAAQDGASRERHFKAQLVSLKVREGQGAGSVVYFLDETATSVCGGSSERSILFAPTMSLPERLPLNRRSTPKKS